MNEMTDYGKCRFRNCCTLAWDYGSFIAMIMRRKIHESFLKSTGKVKETADVQ